MVFLIGAVLAFAGMGILHKMGDRWKAQPVHIALFTMSSSCLISAALAFVRSTASLGSIPPAVWLLAMPFGVCAALGLWFFQAGLRHGHIATSWLIINLSSAIPTLLSILVYRETITPRRMGIFGLVLSSLVLLWWDRRKGRRA